MIKQAKINNETFLFLRNKNGTLIWTLKMDLHYRWFKCRGSSNVYTVWKEITQTEANLLEQKFKD